MHPKTWAKLRSNLVVKSTFPPTVILLYKIPEEILCIPVIMIMAVRLRVGPPNFLQKVKGIVHHSTTIARFLPDMQVHFLSFLFLSEFEAEVHMSSRNKQLLELLIIMPVYNPSAFDMSSFLNALVFHCCHCFYGLFLAAQTLNFKCISHHWSIRVGLQ